MSIQYFEFKDGASDKFWEIDLQEKSVILRWGKRGTKGQSKTKTYASEDEALNEYKKSIIAKQNEGYIKTSAPARNLTGSDFDALQGLWKIKSYISRGTEVITSNTHLLIDRNKLREIDPTSVDDETWGTFTLDENIKPKRIAVVTELQAYNGQRYKNYDNYIYELKGKSLKLCMSSGAMGEFPGKISSDDHNVISYVKDNGPVPEPKKRSDIKPVKDPVLGTLTWNDNHDSWESVIKDKGGKKIEISIDSDKSDSIIPKARELASWILDNKTAIKEFAAQKLLKIYNKTWEKSKSIDTAGFMRKISLQSITIDVNGNIDIYCNDGKLFLGHCIIISIDKRKKMISANIAG